MSNLLDCRCFLGKALPIKHQWSRKLPLEHDSSAQAQDLTEPKRRAYPKQTICFVLLSLAIGQFAWPLELYWQTFAKKGTTIAQIGPPAQHLSLLVLFVALATKETNNTNNNKLSATNEAPLQRTTDKTAMHPPFRKQQRRGKPPAADAQISSNNKPFKHSRQHIACLKLLVVVGVLCFSGFAKGTKNTTTNNKRAFVVVFIC
jgi:hypothetical protein